MPQVALPPGVTDEDYVLGAAACDRRPVRLRLGLRHKPEDGFFRVVFLARRRSSTEIYDLVGEFTRDFLAAAAVLTNGDRPLTDVARCRSARRYIR